MQKVINGYKVTKTNHKNGRAKVYTFSCGEDKKYPLRIDIKEAFLKAQSKF
jgi:hypothetical protein